MGLLQHPQAKQLATPKITRKEIVEWTSQLAIMLRAGVDVSTAMKSLYRQARKPGMQMVLGRIQQAVLGGTALSVAVDQFRPIFGESYVASIAAGEASGRLPDVLYELSHLERSHLKLLATVRTILAYPVLLIAVSTIVIICLLLFVLPQFAAIFAQYEMPLPFISRVLIAVSVQLRTRLWLWTPIALAAGAGLLAFRSSESGRRTIDRLMLKNPMFGEVTQLLLIGRVCRLMGIMINSGVPMLDSLRLSRTAVANTVYRKLISDMERSVLNGQGLTEVLSDCTVVPAAAAEMLMTGEQTGTMGVVTNLIGRHFEEEGEAKLREAAAVLEPLLTVVMGAVVAVIVMAVMLPMFDLSTFANG
jgi:type II secretory pathway component PulF